MKAPIGARGINRAQFDELMEMMAYYAQRPLQFVKQQINAKPTKQQEEVLRALPKFPNIAVASGHGVGKTTLESWIIIWFLWTHPYAKVPVTAPTQHQLFDVLWSELSMWLSKSNVDPWFHYSQTHLRHVLAPEEWFAVAQTASAKRPESIQGYHSKYILIVADEASGIDDAIFEALEGAQTTDSRMVMFSNPTRLNGTFYDAFNRSSEFWKTFKFSSEDSPLVSDNYVKKMEKRYGRDSDIFRVRVLGEFPLASSDTFINISDVFEAMMREGMATNTVSLGVDVGRGHDESVVVGVSGTKVVLLRRKRLKDLMKSVGMVIESINDLKEKGFIVESIKVDDTGLGGGVTDRLKELRRGNVFKAKVIPINFSTKASDKYHERLIDQMWDNMNYQIKNSLALPNNDELASQLSNRRFKVLSNGKITLESKAEMKSRGLRSPDIADALALALWDKGHGSYEYKSIKKTIFVPNFDW